MERIILKGIVGLIREAGIVFAGFPIIIKLRIRSTVPSSGFYSQVLGLTNVIRETFC